MSEIGFGCGNVGGLMVRGGPQEQLDAVLHAMELGINYFDTAPQYGNGLSEASLGQVLKQVAGTLTVATKVTIGPDAVSDIKGAVQASVETSLSRLGREYVDVLQIHTPITVVRGGGRAWSVSAADVLGSKGIADALESVRSQRLVRFLGFTGLGDTAALHLVVGSGRFDVVQVYYNLLNPSAGTDVPVGFVGQDFGRLISAAASRDMGIVVIRVMAGGALGGPGARAGYASPTIGGALVSGSQYDAEMAGGRNLDFLFTGDVTSLPQAAVRFALMNGGVSTVLVGFSDEKQIDEAAACSGKGAIPDATLERLRVVWSSQSGK